MKETLYILVISMWGSEGVANYPIGQMALQQPMTIEQCNWLRSDGMWHKSTNNKFYFMIPQCFPEDCAGKERCE